MSAKTNTSNSTKTLLIIIGVIVALLLTLNSGIFTTGIVNSDPDITLHRLFADVEEKKTEENTDGDNNIKLGTAVINFTKGIVSRLPELAK